MNDCPSQSSGEYQSGHTSFRAVKNCSHQYQYITGFLFAYRTNESQALSFLSLLKMSEQPLITSGLHNGMSYAADTHSCFMWRHFSSAKVECLEAKNLSGVR